MTWTVSHHANKRIIERFGVKADGVVAWINTTMANATFVSNSYADDGNEARMFASGKILVFADLVENHVMSVRSAYMKDYAKDRIAKLAEKELRKRQVSGLEYEREKVRLMSELESEKIELKLALLKVRSDAKSSALTARLNAVEMRIREVMAEIKQKRREITHLAEGLVYLS